MKNKQKIEEIKLLIPDYVTGSLSEEESNTVKNAIENSSELRELYTVMKNAFEFTDSVKFEEPAPQYWNNLLPRIHQKIEERGQQSLAKYPLSFIWKILVPVAAVVLIFIVYRISYSPAPDITQNENKKYLQENIDSKDTVKKEIEQVQTKKNSKPVITKNNTIRRNKINIKKTNVEKDENYGNENITKTDILVKRNGENGDFASLAIDELSIFGAGTPGILDEDIDNELDKLTDSDRETFLEELNSNL
jgi:hypothetical protein